jgi:hypothetical protein
MPRLEDTMAAVLAHPREAGSAEAAEARDLVAAHLESLGYRVARQRFAFSPSTLNGFPIFGAGLGGLALLMWPLLASTRAPGWGAALVFAGGLAALLIAAIGIGLGWLPLGGDAREDANLIATRSDAPMRRWIVAHLDSKAQVQSMAGRLVAVWVIGVAIAALAALALVRTRAVVTMPMAGAAVAVAVLAGALAARGRLSAVSHGTHDNGTGVATALAAAEVLTDGTTGILITGGEEFGLVGARVFVARHHDELQQAEVVNLDTIDQEGALAVVCHDARGSVLGRREAERLVAAGLGPKLRRLPVGILTDSLPFARAGVPAITIGRLTWRTLRTIHTPQDTAEGLSLDAAARIGRALATN